MPQLHGGKILVKDMKVWNRHWIVQGKTMGIYDICACSSDGALCHPASPTANKEVVI